MEVNKKNQGKMRVGAIWSQGEGRLGVWRDEGRKVEAL